jgi:hypothetical protein
MQIVVPHTCNPSYSGGRDEEDHGLKSGRENGWVFHKKKRLAEGLKW